MYITSSIMYVVLIVNRGGFGLGSETIRGRLQTIAQHSSYGSSLHDVVPKHLLNLHLGQGGHNYSSSITSICYSCKSKMF